MQYYYVYYNYSLKCKYVCIMSHHFCKKRITYVLLIAYIVECSNYSFVIYYRHCINIFILLYSTQWPQLFGNIEEYVCGLMGKPSVRGYFLVLSCYMFLKL